MPSRAIAFSGGEREIISSRHLLLLFARHTFRGVTGGGGGDGDFWPRCCCGGLWPPILWLAGARTLLVLLILKSLDKVEGEIGVKHLPCGQEESVTIVSPVAVALVEGVIVAIFDVEWSLDELLLLLLLLVVVVVAMVGVGGVADSTIRRLAINSFKGCCFPLQ